MYVFRIFLQYFLFPDKTFLGPEILSALPLKDEKGRAEMRSAIVSEIVTEEARVSYWPFLPCL